MSAVDIKDAKLWLTQHIRAWGYNGADAPIKAGDFIDLMVSRGWQMSPDRENRPRPPKAGEACSTCSLHVDRCKCPQPNLRPAQSDRVPPTTTWQQAKADLHKRTTVPSPGLGKGDQ